MAKIPPYLGSLGVPTRADLTPPETPVGRDYSALQPRQGQFVGVQNRELYTRSYYSGSDTRFEIDGFPVADMAMMSFKVAEPVEPLYGYASRTYRRVAHGVRIVNGQFVMNFSDPSSFPYLLQQIKELKSPDAMKERLASYLERRPVASQDIQNLLADMIAGKRTAQEVREYLMRNDASDIASFLPERTISGKPDIETMRAFRDALLGKNPELLTNGSPIWKNKPFGTNPRYTPKYESKPGGFSFRIILGEPENYSYFSQRGKVFGGAVYPNAPLYSYQRPERLGRQLGAVEIITGVEVIGEARSIMENGEPIRTVYDFIAQDIN